MKKRFIPFFLIILLTFSGCSDFNFLTDNLLVSPVLNSEQSLIYNAMISYTGSNITLEYANFTENSTAFLIANIDDESSEEALVFYQKNASSPEAGTVRVNILDKIDGEWQSVYDLGGEGVGIDKAIVSSVGEKKVIFIGYQGLNQNVKNLYIYNYHDNIVDTIFNTSYNYLELIDFEGTGSNAIFTVSNNEEEKIAYANTYISDANLTFFQKSSVKMRYNFSSYVNFEVGKFSQTESAVFADSIGENGNLTTEVISAVNGILYNPTLEFSTQLIPLTVRQSGYYSMDFNGDGIIEIPSTNYFEGYSDSYEGEKFYVTSWYSFEKYYSLVKKYTSFYSRSNSFVFTIPTRWQGVVTVKRDAVTGEFVFYKYEESVANSTYELLRILVTSGQNTQDYLENGYAFIGAKGQIDYLVKVPKDDNESLILTMAEIENNFYI